MADIITIPMTAAQFAAARQALATSPTVTHSATTSVTSGIVQSKLIDFTYVYDGSAELSMTITARHGIVGHAATDNQIKAHLQLLLATV